MTTPSPERQCPTCGVRTHEARCPTDGTETAPPSDSVLRQPSALREDDVIEGRYRITGVLGRGGMGTVYAAVHQGTHQTIALKVLQSQFGASSQETLRFYREAQVTASLRHPNTVRVFDVGEITGGEGHYIAMELLRGPTLEQVLAERCLGEAEAIRIAVPVLRSLQEAHGNRLVHRDLKPSNIILSDTGDDEPTIKVLDFGIARPHESSLTATGTALGTPTYMSPEQGQGLELDGRSDLYALGIILYSCVVGEPPFVDDNPINIMLGHILHPVPDLRARARKPVSDGFVACVNKALAKKPAERYADARSMRVALEALLKAAEARAAEPAPTADATVAGNLATSAVISGPTSPLSAGPTGPVAAASPGGALPPRAPGARKLPDPAHKARSPLSRGSPEAAPSSRRPPAQSGGPAPRSAPATAQAGSNRAAFGAGSAGAAQAGASLSGAAQAGALPSVAAPSGGAQGDASSNVTVVGEVVISGAASDQTAIGPAFANWQPPAQAAGSPAGSAPVAPVVATPKPRGRPKVVWVLLAALVFAAGAGGAFALRAGLGTGARPAPASAAPVPAKHAAPTVDSRVSPASSVPAPAAAPGVAPPPVAPALAGDAPAVAPSQAPVAPALAGDPPTAAPPTAPVAPAPAAESPAAAPPPTPEVAAPAAAPAAAADPQKPAEAPGSVAPAPPAGDSAAPAAARPKARRPAAAPARKPARPGPAAPERREFAVPD